MVDLDNKHDIKNLIGALKNYLHNKKGEDSTEENGTETIVEEERSEVGVSGSDESREIPGDGLLVQGQYSTTCQLVGLKYCKFYCFTLISIEPKITRSAILSRRM